MSQEAERGQLITQLREERLWTRERLAKEAGVSPATITQAEEGRTHIRLSTIGKLAEALEIGPQELLHPKKVKAPTSPQLAEERRLVPFQMLKRQADALRELWEAKAEAPESFSFEEWSGAADAVIKMSLGFAEGIPEGQAITYPKTLSKAEYRAFSEAWHAIDGQLKATLSRALDAYQERLEERGSTTPVADLTAARKRLEESASSKRLDEPTRETG